MFTLNERTNLLTEFLAKESHASNARDSYSLWNVIGATWPPSIFDEHSESSAIANENHLQIYGQYDHAA